MRTGSVEGQGLCHTEVNHFCKRVTLFTSFFVDQYHAHQVEKCIYTVYSIHIFHVYNKYIYIVIIIVIINVIIVIAILSIFIAIAIMCMCTFRYRYASHIVARLGAPCPGASTGDAVRSLAEIPKI